MYTQWSIDSSSFLLPVWLNLETIFTGLVIFRCHVCDKEKHGKCCCHCIETAGECIRDCCSEFPVVNWWRLTCWCFYHVEKYWNFLQSTKRHLSKRLENLDWKLEEQKEISESISNHVWRVSSLLSQIDPFLVLSIIFLIF